MTSGLDRLRKPNLWFDTQPPQVPVLFGLVTGLLLGISLSFGIWCAIGWLLSVIVISKTARLCSTRRSPGP
jgi:hypothetical protein